MSGFSKFIVGLDELPLADLCEDSEAIHVLPTFEIPPLDIIARLKAGGGSRKQASLPGYTRDDFLPRKVAEAERYLKNADPR